MIRWYSSENSELADEAPVLDLLVLTPSQLQTVSQSTSVHIDSVWHMIESESQNIWNQTWVFSTEKPFTAMHDKSC